MIGRLESSISRLQPQARQPPSRGTARGRLNPVEQQMCESFSRRLWALFVARHLVCDANLLMAPLETRQAHGLV